MRKNCVSDLLKPILRLFFEDAKFCRDVIVTVLCFARWENHFIAIPDIGSLQVQISLFHCNFNTIVDHNFNKDVIIILTRMFIIILIQRLIIIFNTFRPFKRIRMKATNLTATHELAKASRLST